jgi:hypothetical protein
VIASDNNARLASKNDKAGAFGNAAESHLLSEKGAPTAGFSAFMKFLCHLRRCPLPSRCHHRPAAAHSGKAAG